MDILAINQFNRLSDDTMILSPSGVYQKLSGSLVEIPEYRGAKSGWYNYYKQLADIKQWHPSLLNNILHQQISKITIL